MEEYIDVSKNRKEKHFYKGFIVVDTDLKEVCRVRMYATQTTHYCCAWFPKRGKAAGAFARGYGYNKEGAAFDNALHKLQIRANLAESEGVSAILGELFPACKVFEIGG